MAAPTGKVHACKACARMFTRGQIYCTEACRYKFHLRVQVYCSDDCRFGAPAPAVYRFVCPDGRSYVGSVKDYRNRAKKGLRRSNSRLIAAFEKYPPEFVYEVLATAMFGAGAANSRAAAHRCLLLVGSQVRLQCCSRRGRWRRRTSAATKEKSCKGATGIACGRRVGSGRHERRAQGAQTSRTRSDLNVGCLHAGAGWQRHSLHWFPLSPREVGNRIL